LVRNGSRPQVLPALNVLATSLTVSVLTASAAAATSATPQTRSLRVLFSSRRAADYRSELGKCYSIHGVGARAQAGCPSHRADLLR